MKVSIFSPDGKNFCQFMTPNVPKPMFLAQIHPGGNGDVGFLYSQNLTLLFFGWLSNFLAISHIFLGPYMERSRRVSMTAWTFSPDG